MPLFKVIFFGILAFVGAIAMFIGAVFFMTSGLDGPINISYPQGGRRVDETITRASDASRYIRLQVAMGWAPLVLGAIALYAGVRKFRG
jgi:hypothetical protein